MAISDTVPPASCLRGGKIVVTSNVTSKQQTDAQTGKTRTVYEYEEHEGKDMAAAQRNADSQVAIKLAGIAEMTFAELDAYIETNATTLATSRVFLKKLAKVVLALVKQQE